MQKQSDDDQRLSVLGKALAVLEAVAARRGVDGKRLVKIHNGVDTSVYRPDAANGSAILPGVTSGALLVGAVGRLNPIKGHTYLVASWPHVVAKVPEARLVLIGPARTADRDRLEGEAKATGCGDSIHFLGQRRDVPLILPSLDVVALPSLTEGFSNVIIEAGAAGRPVVATRVGGNPEAIVDGETGLLVPPKDAMALANAIISLLSEPARRATMGEAARRRVVSLYSVDRMIEGYDRLYASLVQGAV